MRGRTVGIGRRLTATATGAALALLGAQPVLATPDPWTPFEALDCEQAEAHYPFTTSVADWDIEVTVVEGPNTILLVNGGVASSTRPASTTLTVAISSPGVTVHVTASNPDVPEAHWIDEQVALPGDCPEFADDADLTIDWVSRTEARLSWPAPESTSADVHQVEVLAYGDRDGHRDVLGSRRFEVAPADDGSGSVVVDGLDPTYQEHQLGLALVDAEDRRGGELFAEVEATDDVRRARRRTDRLGGANRYETASLLASGTVLDAYGPPPSTRLNAPYTDAVAIASAVDYPDALVAAQLRVPVVLTSPDGLRPEARDAIAALGERGGTLRRAYVVGGEAALSPKVVADLESLGLHVERLSGSDRYATSVLVSRTASVRATVPVPSDPVEEVPTIALASGRGFADALAMGPYSAITGMPLLLTPPDGFTLDNARELQARYDANDGNLRVLLIGGEGALGPDVEAGIRALGATPVRLAGANRYDTAAAVASYFRDVWDVAAARAVLANGQDFPDALAAAAYAARFRGPTVLVRPNALPEPAADLLDSLPCLEVVAAAGGTAAVSDDVLRDAREANDRAC